MPFVLLAVLQQDLVELLDVVLVERDFIPRSEHQVHQFSVTGNFLLVTRLELLGGKVRQQPFDLRGRGFNCILFRSI